MASNLVHLRKCGIGINRIVARYYFGEMTFQTFKDTVLNRIMDLEICIQRMDGELKDNEILNELEKVRTGGVK